MNKHEREILCKGLKFVPNPTLHDRVQHNADIRKFSNKLKKFIHFNTKSERDNNNLNQSIVSQALNNNNDNVRDLFSNPSRCMPPEDKDKLFNSIVESISIQTSKVEKIKNFKNNTSPGQNKVLKT